MVNRKRARFYLRVILLPIVLIAAILAVQAGTNAITGENMAAQASSSTVEGANQLFLPMLFDTYPWQNPFAVEISTGISSGLLAKTEELGSSEVRLNRRISWRNLQPDEGGPLQWDVMATTENEMRSLNSKGIHPVMIINDYPSWATTNGSSCGPLIPEKEGEYAEFVRQLVKRYKMPEFNVHIWELGNEPDVDASLVAPDSHYGCWGDINDTEYYGGQAYGQMLILVSQAIKDEDPSAKVWVGGLLLDRPNSTDSNNGHPELFLKGILQAGAAPYIDAIPYHSYVSYNPSQPYQDWDNGIPDSPWYSWGGGVLGKARFLRQIMSAYGVDKPLYVDEIGLTCPQEFFTACNPPDATFYDMQANYLVRSYVRGLSENIQGYFWYTLNGPGWRNAGLLDAYNNPHPAYNAYQVLAQMLNNSQYAGPTSYGDGTEGYTFRVEGGQIDVVWAKTNTQIAISIPQAAFKQAFDRDNTPVPASLNGSYYQLSVGLKPVYIVRFP